MRLIYSYIDHLGSAVQALDDTGTQTMRLGYSPFGQLMPYQYTGGYTDGNTGFVHLDARWYNPHTSRFVQPDYWNFKNTYLPTEIQHELMRFTGLNTSQLLRDPSQQLAFGYVSGNPLMYVDLFGVKLSSSLVRPNIRLKGQVKLNITTRPSQITTR